MRVIHKNAGRLFPYLIYLVVTTISFDVIVFVIYNFETDIASWLVPDILRIVNTIPAILGACGLFGLVPDAFLAKRKKAAIFHFVNSASFKDFVAFWFVIAGIQLIFTLVNVYVKNVDPILRAIDISTAIASFVCLLVTGGLFLGLFYSRK